MDLKSRILKKPESHKYNIMYMEYITIPQNHGIAIAIP